MSVQVYQIVDDVARTNIGTVANEQLDNFNTLLNDKFGIPLQITLSSNTLTIKSSVQQKLESDGSDSTQNSYKWRIPPINGNDVSTTDSTLDFTNGNTTGDFANNPDPGQAMTASYYVQMGIEIRSNGKFYIVWGTESATLGGTTVPTFSTGAIPLMIAKLQDDGSSGTWNFNTPSKSDLEIMKFNAEKAAGGSADFSKILISIVDGNIITSKVNGDLVLRS